MRIFIYLIGLLVAGLPAQAQRHARRYIPAPTVEGDLATLKEKAELGDLKAQVALGNHLVANQYFAQSLGWYRKAAEKGDLEAKFHLGDFLLFGRPSTIPKQSVVSKPSEGVRWVFEAATNFHPMACRDMSYALQQGLGVNTNLVQAYAWLELSARSNNVSLGRQEMDRLALRMDLKDIQAAHVEAKNLLKRNWPELSRKLPDIALKLKVTAITLGPVPLAIINHKTVEQGECMNISMDGARVTLKCLRITGDSVEVTVDDDEPFLLRIISGQSR